MSDRRLLTAEVTALAALSMGTLLLTLAGRVGFAWPLEWMEGGTLQHAKWLLEGKSLYASPTAEFIPYLYPPVSYLPISASVEIAAGAGSTSFFITGAVPGGPAISVRASAPGFAFNGTNGVDRFDVTVDAPDVTVVNVPVVLVGGTEIVVISRNISEAGAP